MAVHTKKRRKIICNGKTYVWFVLTGDRDYWERVASNGETPFLHIISEDKSLILLIPTNAPKSYVVSEGMVFQGKQTSGCMERYLLPFEIPCAVTPKIVSDIIKWAENGENAVKICYENKRFPF